MKTTAPYDIFISYNRHSSNTHAQLLYKELCGRNYMVFLDHKDLPSGNYQHYIFNAIESCKDFIVLLTPTTFDSVWVQDEIQQALLHKRNIIPVIADDFVWPNNPPKWMEDLRNQNGTIYHQGEDFDCVVDRVISLLTCKAAAKRHKYNSDIKAYLAGGWYETLFTPIVCVLLMIALIFMEYKSQPFTLFEGIAVMLFGFSYFYLTVVLTEYMARIVIRNFRNRLYYRFRDIIFLPLSIVCCFVVCGIGCTLTMLPIAGILSLIIPADALYAETIVAGFWAVLLSLAALATIYFKFRYHLRKRRMKECMK